MSFQAYLDNIQAKTGKSVDDFRALAGKKGLDKPGTKHADLMAWLKSEFELGHGHANLIAQLILKPDAGKASVDDRVDALFAGAKAAWRKPYDGLMAKAMKLGDDVSVSPTDTYISLTRSNRKFAIVQPSAAARLDIGVKLKGITPEGRLEASGSWNNMVTHRIRITDAKQIDAQVLAWIKQAYSAI